MFKKFIERSSINKFVITKNIYRIQAYDSAMRGYFCIGFTDFTSLFSPDNF